METLPFAVAHPIEIVRGNDSTPLATISAYPGTPKIVIDSTGVSHLPAVFSTYVEERIAPHFTLSPATKEVFQHLALDGAAPVDPSTQHDPHRRGLVIWVCIAKHPSEILTDTETKWVGDTVARIAEACEVPTDSVTDFPGVVTSRDKSVLMSVGAWLGFSGVASAGVVPFIARFGPGRFNREIFMEGLDRDATVQDLAVEFPPFRGRPIIVGSKGARVVLLQTVFGLGNDGTFTEELGELIVTFKKTHLMDPTPVVDSATWGELAEHVRGHPHAR